MTSTSDVDENDKLDWHSPHYFIFLNRDPRKLHRRYQMTRSDAYNAVKRAHDAVIYLANLDADYARKQNGQGFSKSDSKIGHQLARCPQQRVLNHWALSGQVVKLARKYRRQLPLSLLVDQPDQMSMKV